VFDDGKRPKTEINGSSKKKKKNQQAAAPKPRGYTFSAAVKPDHFVLPYERVTVPTFDLYQDAATTGKKKKESLDIASSMDLPSASTHVFLWTANGRHQIKHKEYSACADSLDSALTIPLFDMLPPSGKANTGNEEEDILLRKRRIKRIQTVDQRNQHWTEVMMEVSSSLGKTLAPLAVASDAELTPETIEWVSQKLSEKSSVAGAALVGLQHVQGADQRLTVLKSVAKCNLSKSTTLAVLSTTTTIQILELLRISQSIGCNLMVGTDLPTKWAQSRRAFLCELEAWEKKKSDSASGESNTKKRRLEASESPAWELDQDGCFDLNTDEGVRVDEHPWFRDDGPLVLGCSCMTCKTYSRAYLYHLVCSKELLAEILLFIHNLHHLLALLRAFRCLRLENDNDAATCFCDEIQAQCKSV